MRLVSTLLDPSPRLREVGCFHKLGAGGKTITLALPEDGEGNFESAP